MTQYEDKFKENSPSLRYWAVTNVEYIQSRTSGRVFTMIFIVWFVSIIVSLAPQFGWKDPEYLQRIEQQKCMVSQDIAYQVRINQNQMKTRNLALITLLHPQVFATCCTFYVPLFVILVLYWKIYQTARRRIHRRGPKKPTPPDNSQVSTLETRRNLNVLISCKHFDVKMLFHMTETNF